MAGQLAGGHLPRDTFACTKGRSLLPAHAAVAQQAQRTMGLYSSEWVMDCGRRRGAAGQESGYEHACCSSHAVAACPAEEQAIECALCACLPSRLQAEGVGVPPAHVEDSWPVPSELRAVLVVDVGGVLDHGHRAGVVPAPGGSMDAQRWWVAAKGARQQSGRGRDRWQVEAGSCHQWANPWCCGRLSSSQPATHLPPQPHGGPTTGSRQWVAGRPAAPATATWCWQTSG